MLRGVEALRGAASLLVVLFHAGAMMDGPHDYGRLPLRGLFNFGHAGVDIFFVLSGFIITLVHRADLGRPRRAGRFLRKRFVRIFPTYWIASLIMLALLLLAPTPDGRLHDPWFMVMNFSLLPWARDLLIGPAWSLRQELVFYGAFTLCVLNRSTGLAVMGMWFAGIAANGVYATITGRLLLEGVPGHVIFPALNGEFLVGIIAALLVNRAPPARPGWFLCAGLLLLCILGAIEDLAPPFPLNWPPLHLAYAVASMLILCGLVGWEKRFGLHVPQALLVLGDASYALYLLHVIVIGAGLFALRRLHLHAAIPMNVAFGLLVLVSVVAALLFTRWVERPLLARMRRKEGLLF